MSTFESSPPMHISWSVHLRLVSVLAGKDIVDAVKTKATLSTIIISLVMVLFYRYMPALTQDSDTLNVLLYAEGESALTAALESSPELALYTFDSRQQLMDAFVDAESLELAVVIPEADLAQQQSGGPITIDGHLMYWVSPEQRAAIKAMIEDDLSEQLAQPVTLNLSGNDVYFDAGTTFFVFSSAIALLFVTVMIGMSLIPNLMIEEKQSRTMDALLVSPVSPAHLVAGKALAGLFYGLLGSAIVLFAFRHLIVQWELAILAAVLATLFMVAIGLLLGSVAKVRAQLQLVGWFVIVPLLIPVILVMLQGLVPDAAIAVMNWIPTVLIARIFNLSLTPNAVLADYVAALAVVIVSTLAILVLVVQIVQRQDRG